MFDLGSSGLLLIKIEQVTLILSTWLLHYDTVHCLCASNFLVPTTANSL